MKCGYVIGKVGKQMEPFETSLSEADNKRYVLSEVTLGSGIKLPLVIDEATYDVIRGKVSRLYVYIRSERHKGLFTYLQTLTGESVAPTTPLTKHIPVGGVVVKMSDSIKICEHSGAPQAICVVRYQSWDKNVSIVHCYGIGLMAHELMDNVKVGDIIEIDGILSKRGNSLEYCIEKLSNCGTARSYAQKPKSKGGDK